jgi:flagellar protein FlaJ
MAKKGEPRKRGIMSTVAEMLSPYFPDLKKKLALANIDQRPSQYMERVVASSLTLSVAFIVLTAIFLIILFPRTSLIWLAPLAIIYFAIFFSYLMLYVDAMVIKRKKELDYEIVFAGRQIMIALKSGMPLFDAIVGATSGYGTVSKELTKVADKVVLGIPLTQAIREETQNNPSKYFVRVLMQIANSLSSGADVGSSLEVVLAQISKEQMIALKEYSQKLTPIVMFFMIFGIIVPSLGVVLVTVVFSAISGGLTTGMDSTILVPVFFMIAVVQYLFLGMIESSRPKYII